MSNKRILISMLLIAVVFISHASYAVVFEGDLIAYWKMDETSGTTVADASGNGLDGELMGNGSFVAGMYGNAVDLNFADTTVSTYILVPHDDLLAIGDGSVSSEMTVTAWINFAEGDSSDNLKIVAMKGHNWQQPWGYRLEVCNGTETNRYMGMYGGGASVWGSKAIASQEAIGGGWTAGEWYHVAYSVLDGRAYLYHNGTKVGENAEGNPFVLMAAPDSIDFIIGAATSVGIQEFGGLIDDVRVYAFGTDDETEIAEIMDDDGSTAVEPFKHHASGFALDQNYPNPFNPSTTINYSVPATGNVRITVYDVLGQAINTLVDEAHPMGQYQAVWNGTDQSGNAVPAGMYFYRMETEGFSQMRKMLLVK